MTGQSTRSIVRPVRTPWSYSKSSSTTLVSVPLAFGLAYFFTDQIKAVMAGVHKIERWLGLAGLLALAAAVLVVGMWRWHRRVGKDHLDQERGDKHSPTP